jgi:hypothetical protein
MRDLRYRMTIEEAATDFVALVDRVINERVSVDLVRDNVVVARPIPAKPQRLAPDP